MAKPEKLLCGVDFGGTKLAIGLVDKRGKLIDKVIVFDHTSKKEDDVILEIASLIKDLLSKNNLKENELEGVGVGFPGHIRNREGITIISSNLNGFRNYPLKKNLQKYFSIPILTDNDANAQAFAEFKYGAGRGYKSEIFVTISSGVGAGIIIDGKIYHGITGTAGEFGHMIVNPNGTLKCGCGNYGCLWTYVSGIALGKIFKEHLLNGEPTLLPVDKTTPDSEINGKLLKKGLEINDPLTKRIINESAKYMGIGLYNIFQIFNPPVIIIGGGLVNLGDYYMDLVKKHFYNLARNMLFDKIEIKKSRLMEDAGVIGAASLLME